MYAGILCLVDSVDTVVFRHNMDEVKGDLRKLHNVELNDLYCSPNTVRVTNWKRIRWTGHVARMGERNHACRVWWGNLMERDHLVDPCVDGWIVLRWIFRKWDVVAWTRVDLAYYRDRCWAAFVSAVTNLRFPQNVGDFLTSCKPVRFSRRTLLQGVSKYPFK